MVLLTVEDSGFVCFSVNLVQQMKAGGSTETWEAVRNTVVNFHVAANMNMKLPEIERAKLLSDNGKTEQSTSFACFNLLKY